MFELWHSNLWRTFYPPYSSENIIGTSVLLNLWKNEERHDFPGCYSSCKILRCLGHSVIKRSQWRIHTGRDWSWGTWTRGSNGDCSEIKIFSRAGMEDIGSAAMLAAKRLAGVTPEVNLREFVACIPLPCMNKTSTLALKVARKKTLFPNFFCLKKSSDFKHL